MENTEHIRVAQKARAALDGALVKHPRFTEALQKIESAIIFPPDGRLVCVVGPTGVGKSKLLRTVKTSVNRMVAENLLEERGVPYLDFEVPCPQIGQRFSWNEYYYRYHDQLAVPLLPGRAPMPTLPEINPKRGLEAGVLNAVKQRQPHVILQDEANHFAATKSAKVLFDQTNRLKSFVTRSGVVHVLFGTYELAQMTTVSGQLARRAQIIHLSRYSAEVPGDLAAFKIFARSIQKHLPLATSLDLPTIGDYLHERTIGCVGVLKTWLTDALAHANRDGRPSIKRSDLEATAIPVSRLQIMLREAIDGERAVNECEEQLTMFRDELGHTKPDNHGPLFNLPDPKPEKPKTENKPFQKEPIRLPVGGAFDGTKGSLAS